MVHQVTFTTTNQLHILILTIIFIKNEILFLIFKFKLKFLFNLKYDSRLIIGTDLLSTSDGLAMFDNRSWVTDKGTYFTATGEFIKKSDVSDDYVNKQMQIVNNKINLSSYFMDTNYYNIVSNYVKWLVKIL